MRIVKFRIENYRNIKLAECDNPPDFMVICGGNGSGKSALLHALMATKEYISSFGSFQHEPQSVSADADAASISFTVGFNDRERQLVEINTGQPCPMEDDVSIVIGRQGSVNFLTNSQALTVILNSYDPNTEEQASFFDFIDAHRMVQKQQISSWDSSALSGYQMKQTLSATGSAKFNLTKQYLASLKMRDLQAIQSAQVDGLPLPQLDSLAQIRTFFDEFFSPLQFKDVRLDTSPFRFVIKTPRGEIDIDDLSSGEKEILNVFVRFHQLRPHGSIILFDEADAHLHPDLERRYLEVLRDLAHGNQLWVTTHSPEMMIAAGSASLYTLMKQPPADGGNQLVRVTQSQELHAALSEVMGPRGLVSFNQRIIFIEGEDASADRAIYEAAFPPGKHNVSFVPAGNSGTVRKTAERVNELLQASLGFQHYYSIVDHDIDRAEPDPTGGKRLFRLPVYHVENLLINAGEIFAVASALLREKFSHKTPTDVENELRDLATSEQHLKPYTKALFDAHIAAYVNKLSDLIFKNQKNEAMTLAQPSFSDLEVEAKAILTKAIGDGSWRAKCKGRDLLKAFCSDHGLDYEQFRNLLISRITSPLPELIPIMEVILEKPKEEIIQASVGSHKG